MPQQHTPMSNPATRSSRFGGQQYLEAVVSSASPAKLRLMMIERAIDVAGALADAWRGQPAATGPNELSLKLLDLLSELLEGVTAAGDQALNRQVADLYVFLTQHLLSSETTADAAAIEEIATVLQIEAETWRLVCARESPASVPSPAGHGGSAAAGRLNIQA